MREGPSAVPINRFGHARFGNGAVKPTPNPRLLTPCAASALGWRSSCRAQGARGIEQRSAGLHAGGCSIRRRAALFSVRKPCPPCTIGGSMLHWSYIAHPRSPQAGAARNPRRIPHQEAIERRAVRAGPDPLGGLKPPTPQRFAAIIPVRAGPDPLGRGGLNIRGTTPERAEHKVADRGLGDAIWPSRGRVTGPGWTAAETTGGGIAPFKRRRRACGRFARRESCPGAASGSAQAVACGSVGLRRRPILRSPSGPPPPPPRDPAGTQARRRRRLSLGSAAPPWQRRRGRGAAPAG